MALVPEEDDGHSYDESDPEDEKVSEEEQLNGNSSTDSLHLDEEEEECEDGGSSSGNGLSCPCPLQCCNLSDRFVGWSIVLHIDQTASTDGSGNRGSFLPAPLPTADGDNNNNNSGEAPPGISLSASTSLSDTASDNMSTRATLGDTPSVPDIDAENNNEDSNSNSTHSSPPSSTNSVAERMRRIHNSIFSSLEHDLAELVRIREETIQFLETGVRPTEDEERSAGLVSTSARLSLDDVGNGGEGESSIDSREALDGSLDGGHRPSEPFVLRERLTFQTRPRIIAVTRSRTAPSAMEDRISRPGKDPDVINMDGRSYTPTGDYDNAPPAQPAKPYVEVGPTSCEEKGIAARKIMNKLQYGDPEDEVASFVRRFWRETSTVEENTVASASTSSPLSVDIAAIAERTASLEASLEEAFDGLRLRLQEMGPQRREQNAEGSTQTGGASEGNGGGRESSTNTNNDNSNGGNLGSSSLEYEAWNTETSIINNPLNYDIWDELEGGNDAGPIITGRINLAERRSSSSRVIRRHNDRSATTSTCNVGVGTSSMEGAELDDDTTDDDEVSNYFQIRNLASSTSLPVGGGRAFLAEMGVSDELEREIMDMFSFSEDEFNIPSSISVGANAEDEELPLPLFTREIEVQVGENINMEHDSQAGGENQDDRIAENAQENETIDNGTTAPDISLDDGTFRFCPNREDDCSVRVYLDEHDLNFPLLTLDESHNEGDHGEREYN